MMRKFAMATALVAALTLVFASMAFALSGNYKAKVTTNAFKGSLKGTWTIGLSGGKYTVKQNGSTLLHGKYSTSGNKITIGGGGKNAFCETSGTYTYHLSGNKLTFKAVSDGTKKCAGRRDVLTSGPFTKF